MFFRAFILTLALGFSSNVFLYHSAWALDALPDNNSSFTHTLELKPIPHNYQLAKATFLPDRYDDLGLSDYDSIKSIQPDRNCESYTLSSCPSGGLCERCPFDVRKFRAYACTAPYLMSNGDCICPAETPLIYPNDKCTLYCGSRCIQKTCTPSANKTNCTNSTQNCDNGCGQNTRKCCVPCTHKLTSKPANSSYTYCSCTDDSGTKQIQCGCTCNAGYHLKNGTCGSGGICEKDCIANTCSGYTLATCPAHANCTSCSKQTTGCTGGGTVFKMTGCQSGYHQSGNSCVAHSYTCPSGYQASSCSSSQTQTGTTSKKCSCGAASGTCYACRAKTCEEKGQKTCNGSCIATSECCGGCPSGQKCSNGTCIKKVETCFGSTSCQSGWAAGSCRNLDGQLLYQCDCRDVHGTGYAQAPIYCGSDNYLNCTGKPKISCSGSVSYCCTNAYVSTCESIPRACKPMIKAY